MTEVLSLLPFAEALWSRNPTAILEKSFVNANLFNLFFKMPCFNNSYTFHTRFSQSLLTPSKEEEKDSVNPPQGAIHTNYEGGLRLREKKDELNENGLSTKFFSKSKENPLPISFSCLYRSNLHHETRVFYDFHVLQSTLDKKIASYS